MQILKLEDLSSIKELIDIYMRAYNGLEEYAYNKKSDVKKYIKWLYKADKDGMFLAKCDDKLIGFIAFCHNWWDRIYGEIGEIHEIVVVPEYQGKGIGKLMLERAINSIKNYHNIIGLWVGDKNKKAILFYKKMGFLEKGRIGKWIRMIKKN